MYVAIMFIVQCCCVELLAMSMLPSISDLANAAKRHKSELSALRSTYEAAKGYDINYIGLLAKEKLSLQQKERLLLSTSGVSSINKVRLYAG